MSEHSPDAPGGKTPEELRREADRRFGAVAVEGGRKDWDERGLSEPVTREFRVPRYKSDETVDQDKATKSNDGTPLSFEDLRQYNNPKIPPSASELNFDEIDNN